MLTVVLVFCVFQRMSSLLEGLERSLGSVPRSMAAQLGDTGRFLQALRDACSHAPLDLRTVEDLLTAELERSSTAAQLSTNTLQVRHVITQHSRSDMLVPNIPGQTW